MGANAIVRSYLDSSARFTCHEHALEVSLTGVPGGPDIEALRYDVAQLMRAHRVNAFMLDVQSIDGRFDPRHFARGLLPAVDGMADTRPGAILCTPGQSSLLRPVSTEAAHHGALMPTYVSRERALRFLAEEVALWATDCRHWLQTPQRSAEPLAAERMPGDGVPGLLSSPDGLTERPSSG